MNRHSVSTIGKNLVDFAHRTDSLRFCNMRFQCHNPPNAMFSSFFRFQSNVQRGPKTLKLNNPFRTESPSDERNTAIVP